MTALQRLAVRTHKVRTLSVLRKNATAFWVGAIAPNWAVVPPFYSRACLIIFLWLDLI
jgi:hypothetical protein